MLFIVFFSKERQLNKQIQECYEKEFPLLKKYYRLTERHDLLVILTLLFLVAALCFITKLISF